MTETKAPTLAQQKKEELFLQRTNGYDVLTQEDREAMERYCTAYKHFLDEGKTERECVSYAVALAQQAGFRPLERGAVSSQSWFPLLFVMGAGPPPLVFRQAGQ